LLIPQLFGDYWYLLALTVSFYFLGIARLRVYMVAWTVYYGIYITLTLTYLGRLQILALPIGYLASAVIMAVSALVWLARTHPGRPTVQTLEIVALGAATILTQCAVVTYAPAYGYRAIV